jgi:DNA polymerase-4
VLQTKDDILPLAKQLMQSVEYHSHPIRLIGLGVSNPGSPPTNGGPASQQHWTELELQFEPWP